MKKTTFYKGHRWTNEELKKLMSMWADDTPISEIAAALNVNERTVFKMTCRLRSQGIPLKRRAKGHVAGRANQPWTQAEIEYLIRRRHEKATVESISSDLGRTFFAVQAMIYKLRSELVPVPMYGCGVRRLWDANTLRATFIDRAEETIQ